MTFQIGFSAVKFDNSETNDIYTAVEHPVQPRKSVVQVYFSKRNMTLSYYNDRFDLHQNDMVYVEGKLEGLLGRVVEVNYNFKIKVSDYKRVISVVNTDVNGQFFMAGSHFVTFDSKALPAEKAITWFRAPYKEEDEFVSGSDDTAFCLDDLSGMKVSNAIAERGGAYYRENKVRYLSIDGTRGYAIVEGTQAYEVEFVYQNNQISGLVCSCFCAYNCKHEFAAILQLKETLEIISKDYAAEYERSGYFAAVDKGTLFSFAVDGRKNGSFTL